MLSEGCVCFLYLPNSSLNNLKKNDKHTHTHFSGANLAVSWKASILTTVPM